MAGFEAVPGFEASNLDSMIAGLEECPTVVHKQHVRDVASKGKTGAMKRPAAAHPCAPKGKSAKGKRPKGKVAKSKVAKPEDVKEADAQEADMQENAKENLNEDSDAKKGLE